MSAAYTDFQRGFIKAEVIGFRDFVAGGSAQAARSAGKARLQGKDDVVQDGDAVESRFTSTRDDVTVDRQAAELVRPRTSAKRSGIESIAA